MLTNVISIPILIAAVGADRWSGIAVGQAVGAVGTLLVQCGWAVTGPAEVAMADAPTRGRIYAESVWVRLAVLPFASAGCIFVMWLAGHLQLAPVIASIATAALGMSPAWYLVGVARPTALFFYETVPRGVATVGGAVLCLIGLPLVFFPAALLLATLLTLGVSLRLVPMGHFREALGGIGRSTLRSQLPGLGMSSVSALYKYLPVVVASALVSQSGVTAYAMADKLLKLASAGTRPLTQVLQGWVPAARSDREWSRRRSIARKVNLTAAALCAVCFGALCRPAGDVLSHGEVRMPWLMSWCLGGALGLALASSTTGLIFFVALGIKRQLVTGAFIGATVFLLSVFPAARFLGARGIAMSVLFAEFSVQVFQTAQLRRLGEPKSIANR